MLDGEALARQEQDAATRPLVLSPDVMARREDERARSRLSLWRAFAESVIFPIRGRAAIITFLQPVLMVAPVAIAWYANPAIVLLVTGSGLVIGFAWLVRLFDTASLGPDARPAAFAGDVPEDSIGLGVKIILHFGVVVVFVPLAGALLLAQAGVFVDQRLDCPWPYVLLLMYLLGYCPMSLAIVGCSNRLFAGLNPFVVVRSIARVPVEYGSVVAFTAALVGMVAALSYWIPEALSDWGALPRSFLALWHLQLPFVWYYVLCVIVSRLGFMAYRNWHRLDWG